MGISELAQALGIDKSVVSRLVKKGMPVNSASAAQAWREVNAKPRAKKGQAGEAPPKPKIDEPKTAPVTAPAHDAPEPDDDDNTPRQSLRRARLAEKVGYNELVLCKRNGGSIEDIRKANSIYIAARNNRHKAERDFKEWQRAEGILLYFDEAKEIAGRPHVAAKQMLEVMPKSLAPRLFGQPQKAIEAALSEWCDSLTEVIRKTL
jgi:hypothetical protein